MRLAGSVHNLNLILNDDGLVIRGCVRSYYSKQLAQHAVMQFTKMPIRANEIEVTLSDRQVAQTKIYGAPLPENGGAMMAIETKQRADETVTRSRRKT